MTEHDLHLLKLLVIKLAENVNKRKLIYTKRDKLWKELSGEEWTQRCIDQDWEKDKPNMGWWKE